MKILKNHFRQFVLILLIAFFSDCKTETPVVPEITLDKQELQFTYENGTNQLLITANLRG